jgi:hypothetical protein
LQVAVPLDRLTQTLRDTVAEDDERPPGVTGEEFVALAGPETAIRWSRPS